MIRSRTETHTVIADDGVRLHAEISGDHDAPVTVVFCHGYTLSLDSWHFQRTALAKRARIVAWDQRGHGRSGLGKSSRMTIDQLGRDLAAVLRHTTPEGPVILAGHSMGGMTILAMAEQHPELIDDRLVATALITTAAEPISGTGLGLPAQTTAAAEWTVRRAAWLAQLLHVVPGCARGIRELAVLVARRYAFASTVPDPVMTFLADMIQTVSVEAVLQLFPQFLRLDLTGALPVLDGVDTLVLSAGRDLIVLPEHADAIARAMPSARHEVVPHAGHLLPLEYPNEVNTWLHDLVDRATATDTAVAIANNS